VREALEKSRLVEVLARAAKMQLEGMKKEGQDIEDLAGGSFEVEISEGVTSTASFGALGTSRYVGGVFPNGRSYPPQIEVVKPADPEAETEDESEDEPEEELVTHESDQALREAGFSTLNLSLVSASEGVLARLRRPHTLEKYPRGNIERNNRNRRVGRQYLRIVIANREHDLPACRV